MRVTPPFSTRTLMASRGTEDSTQAIDRGGGDLLVPRLKSKGSLTSISSATAFTPLTLAAAFSAGASASSLDATVEGDDSVMNGYSDMTSIQPRLPTEFGEDVLLQLAVGKHVGSVWCFLEIGPDR